MTAYRCNGGKLVPLEAVRGVFQRLPLFDEEKVNRFVDLMKEGCEFPPIKVQQEQGGYYRVMEGHHRFLASRRCAFTEIPVEISQAPL